MGGNDNIIASHVMRDCFWILAIMLGEFLSLFLLFRSGNPISFDLFFFLPSATSVGDTCIVQVQSCCEPTD